MNKDIDEIFDLMDEEETALLLEDTEHDPLDKKTAKRIFERTAAMAGLESGEKGIRRLRLKPAYVIAACLLLAAALGAGAIAYASDEQKAFEEASEFFETNEIDSEGLSRKDIKTVYEDISSERFTEPETEKVLISNIKVRNNDSEGVFDDEYYGSLNGKELWNMFNMCNSLISGERMMTDRELFIIPSVLNYYQGAGLICCYVPDVSAELVCDNACLGNMQGPYVEPGETLSIKKAAFGVFIGGGKKTVDGHESFKFEGDSFAVRIKMKKDGGVVGYALVCFWGVTPSDWPGLNNASIVKAVMLNEPITDEEADARLDEVYNEKVAEAGLYETESIFAYQWNDWYERNGNDEWYKNVFYHVGRWWEQ